MRYELKSCTEKIGPLSLAIESIEDLDRAIDALCEGVDEKTAERVFVEDLCPYFGVVWPAARALAEHVARMGGWLKGRTFLEVGCGLAIPSLVASKLGANVIATDFHPEVPRFLARNQRLNGLDFEYRKLDWREDRAAELGKFEFVAGSDILYESGHPKAVARALARYCAPKGHILLSDPGRSYLQSCVDELNALGFRHDTFVSSARDAHDDRAGDKETKEVFVFAFANR